MGETTCRQKQKICCYMGSFKSLQLIRAPAVSGAENYQELIVASKNEEKHLADLKKRQEYTRSILQTPHLTQKLMRVNNPPGQNVLLQTLCQIDSTPQATDSKSYKKCYYCKKPGLLHKKKEDESQGPNHSPSAKQVVTDTTNQSDDASHNVPQSETEPRNKRAQQRFSMVTDSRPIGLRECPRCTG